MKVSCYIWTSQTLDHPSNSLGFPFPDQTYIKLYKQVVFCPFSLRAVRVNTHVFAAIVEKNSLSWKQVIKIKGGGGEGWSVGEIKYWSRKPVSRMLGIEKESYECEGLDLILQMSLWHENSNKTEEA